MLMNAINDYKKDIELIIELFKKKIGNIHPLKAWRNGTLKQRDKLTNNIEIYFHGIGMSIFFLKEDIDFDFDFGHNDRYDGIDYYKLKDYIEQRLDRYPEYNNMDNLKKDFDNLIKNNVLLKFENKTDRLYYTANAPGVESPLLF